MRLRALRCFVAVVAITLAQTALAQCVSFVGDSSPQGTGAFIILNNVNFPDDSKLQQAASAWNNSSCNTNGTAFPTFQFGSSPSGTSRLITVNYDPGPANGICGQRFGESITLYG